MNWKNSGIGLLVLATFALGCVNANRKENVSSYANQVHKSECEETDRLCVRIETIAKFLGQRGFFPSEPPVERNTNRVGKTQMTIGFRKTMRVVAVTIGSEPELNLDIVVRDQEGNIIAADTTSDARAVVSFVADSDVKYVISSIEREGTGRFVLAVYSAPVSTPPISIIGFFNADPVERTTWSEVENLMASDLFLAHQGPQKFVASRLESRSFTMKLQDGFCYTIISLGSRGLDRLDARLRTKGKLLLADLSGRPETWIRHCPTEDTTAQLTIKVKAGSGAVSWGSFVTSRNIHPEIDGPKLRLPPPRNDQAIKGTSIKKALDELGYGKEEPLLRVKAVSGARFEASFSLEKGECATLYTLTDIAPSKMDLQINSNGEPVPISPKFVYGNPQGLCCEEYSTYYLNLVTLTGEGYISTFLRRLPPYPNIDLGHTPQSFSAREAIAVFSNVGMSPMGDPILLHRTGEARVFRASFNPSQSRCHGIAVFQDAHLLSVSITDARGQEVGAWRGNKPNAELASCLSAGKHTILVLVEEVGISPPSYMVFQTDSPLEMEDIFRDSDLKEK